jgi:hypothetical protein
VHVSLRAALAEKQPHTQNTNKNVVPVTESPKRAFEKEGVVTERRGRRRRRRRGGGGGGGGERAQSTCRAWLPGGRV